MYFNMSYYIDSDLMLSFISYFVRIICYHKVSIDDQQSSLLEALKKVLYHCLSTEKLVDNNYINKYAEKSTT